jgi:hemin uptake protein HemP
MNAAAALSPVKFDPPEARPAPGAAREAQPARVASDQLLAGRRVVEIDHHGEVYRLQTTRLGKLILTK